MAKARSIDTLGNYMSERELALVGSMMLDPEQLSDAERLKRAQTIWLTMPSDLKLLSRRPFRPFRGITIRSRYPDANLLMFIIGNHWRGKAHGCAWDGHLTERTFSVLQGGHALTALTIVREIRAGRLPRS